MHTSFCESFLYFFYFLFVLNTCFVNKSISKKKKNNKIQESQTNHFNILCNIHFNVCLNRFCNVTFYLKHSKNEQESYTAFRFWGKRIFDYWYWWFLVYFFFFPFFIFIDKFFKNTIMFCILCYRRKYSKRRSLWCSSQYIFSK